jgi:alditol oxidase
LVAGTNSVSTLGSGHSFNRSADTAGVLVSLRSLPRRIDIDTARRVVRVDGGMTYSELGAELHRRGWALHNLASLPHITVAGAIATSTHGSGASLGSLSSAVVEVELVTASGELVTITKNDPMFPAGIVGLGAFGVCVALTLAIEPTFEIAQEVQTEVPLTTISADLDGILSSAYSVSIFTRWSDHGNSIWRKHRIEESGERSDTSIVSTQTDDLHPIEGGDASACTIQRMIPGPWHERLPHFRPDVTPSAGNECRRCASAQRNRRSACARTDGVRDPHGRCR